MFDVVVRTASQGEFPTGEVRIFLGDKPFLTRTLANQQTSFSFTPADFPADLKLKLGSNSLRAVYSGQSGVFNGSEGTLNQTMLARFNPKIVAGAQNENDPQVRVFDAAGKLLYELEPFEKAVKSTHVTLADFTGDGVLDVVVAAGNGGSRVMIFDGNTKAMVANFYGLPTGVADIVLESITLAVAQTLAIAPGTSGSPGTISGGAFVAAGDFNGDGVPDLVVGAGPGLISSVRVIDGSKLLKLTESFADNSASLGNFVPYEGTFNGGVVVAVGDVNGDKSPDLITGAASSGAPRVRVFDGKFLSAEKTAVPDFYAYYTRCFGGLNVAAGDVDGDGKAEVVTGTQVGGGPHVRVFGFVGTVFFGFVGTVFAGIADSFAGDPNDRGGVSVAARDLDNDGKAEILAGLGNGQEPKVLIFDGSTLGPARTGKLVEAPTVRDVVLDARALVFDNDPKGTTPETGNFGKSFPRYAEVNLSFDLVDPQGLPISITGKDTGGFFKAKNGAEYQAVPAVAIDRSFTTSGSDSSLRRLTFRIGLRGSPSDLPAASSSFLLPFGLTFENSAGQRTVLEGVIGGVNLFENLRNDVQLGYRTNAGDFTPGPTSIAPVLAGAPKLSEQPPSRVTAFEGGFRGGVYVG